MYKIGTIVNTNPSSQLDAESQQLLAITYVEALSRNDKDTAALIQDQLGSEALLRGVSDINLILIGALASELSPHTGNGGASFILSNLREVILEKSINLPL